MKTAIFAAGCFWGVEAAFQTLPGVLETEVGYTGGHTQNPTYKQVCTGQTGHAEAVRIVYNPEMISYGDLLDVFWSSHNPTTRNRQGWDVGTQYRSAIFYTDEQQREEAEVSKQEQATRWAPQPVVTEITAAGPFYRAEEYHQKYLEKRGKVSCHL